MANLKRKDFEQSGPELRAKPRRTEFGPGALPGESAARDLQRALEARLSKSEEKWSGRRTLAFIVGTCGVFWTVVALGIATVR